MQFLGKLKKWIENRMLLYFSGSSIADKAKRKSFKRDRISIEMASTVSLYNNLFASTQKYNTFTEFSF